MKKKIVFMLINMNIGGTEKALLNMIAEMPKSQYDITILMLEKYGGFLDSVPDSVHVKYLKGYHDIKGLLNNPPKEMALGLLKKGKIVKGLIFISAYLVAKVTNNKGIFFNYILKDNFSLESEYDVAVAYAGPMDFISYFVVNKIKAKKKIQWIHFDVTKIGFDHIFATKVYKSFDEIFVVSEEAKNKLIDLLPTVKRKSEVFINLVSPNLIYKESKEGIGFDDHFYGLRILTVGRLSIEKGQDLAIRALARLINEGYDVKWYCLGDGSFRDKYEQLIKHYHLQDRFILLGQDPNPYPYIDQCDIYVQTSRHEGYCITLTEARHLNKPIVTTNVAGAKEQIKSGKTGFIVDIDEGQIYHAVRKLIQDRKQREEFSMELSKETTENICEMDKIYKLV